MNSHTDVHRQKAKEILVVAGYSIKTAALTGPPRPSVYCMRKCFGGQKPGTALKDVEGNLRRQVWTEEEGDGEKESG